MKLETPDSGALSKKEAADLAFQSYQHAKKHLNDPFLRFQRFEKLAENGHARSMCELGRAYSMGIGTERDVKKSEIWFQRAADMGDMWGYFSLARFYSQQKRYEEARKYLAIASAADFSPALTDMGKIYWLGRGVEKDLPTAKEYFERAANAGSLFAKAYWGRILLREASLKSKFRGFYLMASAFIVLWPVLFSEGFTSRRLVQ